MKEVATTLITLQSSVLGQSPADVGSHSPEQRTSIDISDTVVHGYHNPSKYACRGRTEDGEDPGLGHRLSEPSQVKARVGGCISVCIHFAMCSPRKSLTSTRLMQVLEAAVTTQWTLPDSAQTKYDAFVEKLQVRLGVSVFEQVAYLPPQSLCKLVLPRTYIKLLKEASRFRRPFQARAFALVALCSHLAKELGKLGESVVTVETVNALEE